MSRTETYESYRYYPYWFLSEANSVNLEVRTFLVPSDGFGSSLYERPTGS